MNNNALIDIYEDLEELKFLSDEYQNRLAQFLKSLSRIEDHPSFSLLNQKASELSQNFEELGVELKDTALTIRNTEEIDIESAIQECRNLFIRLRSLASLVGGLITATDWQSPSYASSLFSEAGIQEGKIIANINDYKRDQHLNEAEYQDLFLKEYVEGLKIPVGAYLTSSGMAAFTTIVTFLLSGNKVNGPILAGRSIYFENKEILETFFHDHEIIMVDEMNTDEIIRIYEERQPNLVIFDSLCNAESVAVPNIPEILEHVARTAQNQTFFVIDNSTLSVALQPLKAIPLKSRVKLIVFESLNKYHQFGLDRATGGVVWYRGMGGEYLYDARDHAGTNISDSSVSALPKPNKKYLKRRLARLNRNALCIAESLEKYISQTNPEKIEGIVYPGLKSHPSYEWAKNYSFQGSYFVIKFRESYQKVSEYEKFVNTVIDTARKRGVSINGGTSFGFNTTRVYLTSKNSDYGAPFVRVSVGTESQYEIEQLNNVFEQTLLLF